MAATVDASAIQKLAMNTNMPKNGYYHQQQQPKKAVGGAIVNNQKLHSNQAMPIIQCLPQQTMAANIISNGNGVVRRRRRRLIEETSLPPPPPYESTDSTIQRLGLVALSPEISALAGILVPTTQHLHLRSSIPSAQVKAKSNNVAKDVINETVKTALAQLAEVSQKQPSQQSVIMSTSALHATPNNNHNLLEPDIIMLPNPANSVQLSPENPIFQLTKHSDTTITTNSSSATASSVANLSDNAHAQQQLTAWKHLKQMQNAEFFSLSAPQLEEKLGSWEWINVDQARFPCVVRDGEKYIAVRMIHLRLLNRFNPELPPEIAERCHMIAYKMSELESWIFNTVNAVICKFEYGYRLFNTEDEIISARDVERFYSAVKAFHIWQLVQNYRSIIREAGSTHVELAKHVRRMMTRLEAELAQMNEFLILKYNIDIMSSLGIY